MSGAEIPAAMAIGGAEATPALAGLFGAGAAGAAAAAPALSASAAGAAAAAAPEIAAPPLASLFNSGVGSAALQGIGNMGAQQAGLLAAQTADFGPAGLNATLQAASPGYSSLTKGLGMGAKALNGMQKGQMLGDMMQPQQGPPPVSNEPPPQGQFRRLAPEIGGNYGDSPSGAAQAMILKRLGLLGGM